MKHLKHYYGTWLEAHEAMSNEDPTPRELVLAHAAFARWQGPSEFVALVDEWPSYVVVRTRFLQEALVLAEFAKQIEVKRLRLSDPAEQWPDAYIEIEGATKFVEITEVIDPKRRRDDELRDKKAPTAWLDPMGNFVVRAEAIPGALRTRLEQKAKKRYGSPPMLLIYLDIKTLGVRQKETEQVIAQLKAEYASAFEQIVVLWRERLY